MHQYNIDDEVYYTDPFPTAKADKSGSYFIDGFIETKGDSNVYTVTPVKSKEKVGMTVWAEDVR